MALSHLIKHIYNNGSDDTIRRGKKMHAFGFAEMIEHNELSNSITFRTKDDSYNSFFKVYIQKYNSEEEINLRCTCINQTDEICRHQVAALFQLQEMLDKSMLHNNSIVYRQIHTTLKMKTIDLKMLRMFSSPEIFEHAEQILLNNSIEITKSENDIVEGNITINGSNYPLVIQRNDERNFDTSCTCAESEHPLCEHKAALFLQLHKANGAAYFDSIKNIDKDKNKLLAIYGYSLDDDIKGKFQFIIKEGKPFLKVLDTTIKRVSTVPGASTARSFNDLPIKQITPLNDKLPILKLGMVFQLGTKDYPYFKLEAIQGKSNDNNTGYIGKVEKLDLTKYIETNRFNEDDKYLLLHMRKLQALEVNKFLNKNSPFSGFWENIIKEEENDLPDETKQLIDEYILPKLKKLKDINNSEFFAYYLEQGKEFVTNNLKPIKLQNIAAVPTFFVGIKAKKHTIKASIILGEKTIQFSENKSNNPLFVINDNNIYFWSKYENINVINKYYPTGEKIISSTDWAETQDNLLEIGKNYLVAYDDKLIKKINNIKPTQKILLQEKGEYLIFEPIFSYDGIEEKGAYKPTITIASEDKIIIIERDIEAEQKIIDTLRTLNTNFIEYNEGRAVALKGNDVLEDNWFFLFIDKMKEDNIPLFGFDFLNSYRFNTSKPSTRIHVSSGLDWFDAKIDIDFGGQKVTINEIKRALANKQSVVALGDGTLGILPEEWIKKYSLLFKVGEAKAGQIKLSKYHLGVIDELFSQRDEEEISFELDEKFERIKNFKKIPEIDAPYELNSTLRPYQLAGFQWLNYLSSVGWGGILADDMGLGKTIQALSMLQQFKIKNNRLKAIVVCPTTLLFNWENEIKKFVPDLTYFIHHGTQRPRKHTELENYNVVITTYGTLRSDIQLFLNILLDYVVLDESQAIKNPMSKVTKAACLLSAHNKICMSGTPLQNNTFDIFAQMNFLNPGLLGSMEFFKNEFATPIDKFGERDQKDHLRKILFPFILRRTKEQVAKDLPEKTEQILFCEMEKAQRNIYDAYRNSFRDKILGTIEAQGIEKSQLSILQGLMKLRQICDSPAILNEEEKFENHSIKLDELVRELTENIGDHKALIFSQFLGMLALIKQKLIENGIPFAYFDGSTSSPDRQKAIENFQNNDECRVFLISLKAGGVGLNLTAADYVYIVDPWWNPAVEQQAIDRTHRIGQTKNIFAYRMICKDTIEDKILQLQERKKILAKELITDDNEAGFVKNLSKEDIVYLLS